MVHLRCIFIIWKIVNWSWKISRIEKHNLIDSLVLSIDYYLLVQYKYIKLVRWDPNKIELWTLVYFYIIKCFCLLNPSHLSGLCRDNLPRILINWNTVKYFPNVRLFRWCFFSVYSGSITREKAPTMIGRIEKYNYSIHLCRSNFWIRNFHFG